MADRIRWKQKYDAMAVELEQAKRELGLVTNLHETQRGEVEALKQQLVAAEQKIERARIIGAMGLAHSLLVNLDDVEKDFT